MVSRFWVSYGGAPQGQPVGGGVAMAAGGLVFSESGMKTSGQGVLDGTMVRIAESSAAQVCPHSRFVHWKYISLEIADIALLVLMTAGVSQCGQLTRIRIVRYTFFFSGIATPLFMSALEESRLDRSQRALCCLA